MLTVECVLLVAENGAAARLATVCKILRMGDHPDVALGSTAIDHGFIDVLVTGVDVRLTVRRDGQEDVVVLLGPDAAINLRDLLDQSLEV